MMITTTRTVKTTKIQVTENELLQSFCKNYMELLKDTVDEEDPNIFESEIHRLSDAISSTRKHGFTQLFQEGYTMMILDPKTFEIVENWNEGDHIELVITKDDRSVEVVTHEQMSY
jgi:hypothetical protein